MTIISINKDGWIEHLLLSKSVENGAGVYTSPTVNLEKPGRFRGAATMTHSSANNDNTQAVSLINIVDQGSIDINLNDEITGIRVRIFKQVGTAGSSLITIGVLIFLSK